MPAAVTGDAVVACQRVTAHKVEHSQLVCQCPRLSLVQPHQRRVQDELRIHGQVQGDIQRLDKTVTAIGIPAVIRLRDARHDMADATLSCPYGRYAQEEKIATGHKGIGEYLAIRYLLVHRQGSIRQCIVSQGANPRQLQGCEWNIGTFGDSTCQFHFFFVFLPIAEAQGIHFSKFTFCPEKAGGRVLAATEDDHTGFVVHN